MATATITVTTPYTPIAVEDGKAYVKIPASVTESDDLVEALLLAAKEHVVKITSRLIGLCTVVEYWDGWEFSLLFKLKYGVCSAIASIEAYDGDSWETVAATDYSADFISRPARVKMISTGDYTLGYGLNVVRVTYTAGTADGSDLPAALTAAMYQLIGFWYDKGMDQDASDLATVNALLRPYILNR